MYNIDGIYALRNAVVEQAAKDYISLKKEVIRLENQRPTIKRNIDLEIRSSQLEHLKKWFKSEDFDNLGLNYTGDYYIRKLDYIVEHGSKVLHHQRIERRGNNGS